MKKDKSIKLYNLFFPIFFYYLMPPTMLFILVSNFIFDSIVLLGIAYFLRCDSIKDLYKKTIVKTWLFGFFADSIAAFVVMAVLDCARTIFKEIINSIGRNPFENVYALIFVLIMIFFTGIWIYLFNSSFVFKKIDMEEKQKKIMCLSLAVLTAPWTFLIPSVWIN